MYVVGGYASVLYDDFSNCGMFAVILFAATIFDLHCHYCTGAFACGDTDASGYRFYLSDVWRSEDGENWELITTDAFSVPNSLDFGIPLGRGGHQMEVIQNPVDGTADLWVFGGRGGNNRFGGSEVYFNDVWTSSLVNTPTDWVPKHTSMPWEPRY